MKYLSLAEVKKILEKEQKARELTYEQKLALEHAQKFSTLSLRDIESFVTQLRKIEKITEHLAYKIVDLLPADPEAVRAIFAKERFTLTQEELGLIIDLVKKYKE